MGMVINTNVSSLTAQRHLAESRAGMEQAMERLSSGQRINSAMDDAAGLTIAHSLDSKISSLNQAVRNANDGVALVQLAEGAMDEVSAMLTRMKELATQAINGTYSSADRVNLNLEFQALSSEITRISENTKFNGIGVLNGTSSTTFQVGDTSSDSISVTLQRMGSAYLGATGLSETSVTVTDNSNGTHTVGALGLTAATEQLRIRIGENTFIQNWDTDNNTTADEIVSVINAFSSGTASAAGGVITINAATGTSISVDRYVRDSDANLTSMDLTSTTNAGLSLSVIDEAISDVDSYRATLGAIANRMEHAANNLMSRVEHQSSARSRIQDADYAVESANLAKAQVLQQAGTAMLAQANASTQNILSLLK